jgi:hypothetical protein
MAAAGGWGSGIAVAHPKCRPRRFRRDQDMERPRPDPCRHLAQHGGDIPTDEQDRLVRRIEDIRSMLRDSESLDMIETLLLALADCEQRLAWANSEDVTPDPA